MATILRDRLADIVTAMGYQFVGCEWQRQGRSTLLRIYIDHESGITVEDCARVSRQVSAMLDVEDPVKERYTLEVSSPGLDRPLFEMAHYQKYIGSRVKVSLYTPVNNRRRFVGELLQVNEMNIHLMVDAEEVIFPFSNIEKARLVANI